MSTHKILAAKISNLPKDPGIYIMKDESYKIIYVGKAKNLKNRVRSYFSNKQSHPKIKRLVGQIKDFDIILTKTENLT